MLLLVTVLLLLPVVFGKNLYVEGTAGVIPPDRKRRSYPRWKGPKSDERINGMLADSISLMKELGVLISDSIAPEVKLTGSPRYFGRCCPKGSLKYCTDYDYYIEISGWTIGNSEKSLRSTLIHELIHTVPGGLCHTGEWKKWAQYESKKTEFSIQHYGGNKTEQDEKNLQYSGATY